MTGKEVIKLSLEKSKIWLSALIADLKDSPLSPSTPNGGNHALWILGHVIHSEAAELAHFIVGDQNPMAKWDSLFGRGSTPEPDASKYPGFDELMAEWDRVRVRTLEVLDSFSDADLAKPSKAPPELAKMFGTVADCFAVMYMHAVFHAGQVSDARRLLGRKPVFA